MEFAVVLSAAGKRFRPPGDAARNAVFELIVELADAEEENGKSEDMKSHDFLTDLEIVSAQLSVPNVWLCRVVGQPFGFCERVVGRAFCRSEGIVFAIHSSKDRPETVLLLRADIALGARQHLEPTQIGGSTGRLDLLNANLSELCDKIHIADAILATLGDEDNSWPFSVWLIVKGDHLSSEFLQRLRGRCPEIVENICLHTQITHMAGTPARTPSVSPMSMREWLDRASGVRQRFSFRQRQESDPYIAGLISKLKTPKAVEWDSASWKEFEGSIDTKLLHGTIAWHNRSLYGDATRPIISKFRPELTIKIPIVRECNLQFTAGDLIDLARTCEASLVVVAIGGLFSGWWCQDASREFDDLCFRTTVSTCFGPSRDDEITDDNWPIPANTSITLDRVVALRHARHHQDHFAPLSDRGRPFAVAIAATPDVETSRNEQLQGIHRALCSCLADALGKRKRNIFISLDSWQDYGSLSCLDVCLALCEASLLFGPYFDSITGVSVSVFGAERCELMYKSWSPLRHVLRPPSCQKRELLIQPQMRCPVEVHYLDADCRRAARDSSMQSDHFLLFRHKPVCGWLGACWDDAETHRAKFWHPQNCPQGIDCRNISYEHSRQFSHAPECLATKCPRDAEHTRQFRHVRELCEFEQLTATTCPKFVDSAHRQIALHTTMEPCPSIWRGCDGTNNCRQGSHFCRRSDLCDLLHGPRTIAQEHKRHWIHVKRKRCGTSCVQGFNSHHCKQHFHSNAVELPDCPLGATCPNRTLTTHQQAHPRLEILCPLEGALEENLIDFPANARKLINDVSDHPTFDQLRNVMIKGGGESAFAEEKQRTQDWVRCLRPVHRCDFAKFCNMLILNNLVSTSYIQQLHNPKVAADHAWHHPLVQHKIQDTSDAVRSSFRSFVVIHVQLAYEDSKEEWRKLQLATAHQKLSKAIERVEAGRDMLEGNVRAVVDAVLADERSQILAADLSPDSLINYKAIIEHSIEFATLRERFVSRLPVDDLRVRCRNLERSLVATTGNDKLVRELEVLAKQIGVASEQLAREGSGIGYSVDAELGTNRRVFSILGPNRGHYGEMALVLRPEIMHHPDFYATPQAATAYNSGRYHQDRPWLVRQPASGRAVSGDRFNISQLHAHKLSPASGSFVEAFAVELLTQAHVRGCTPSVETLSSPSWHRLLNSHEAIEGHLPQRVPLHCVERIFIPKEWDQKLRSQHELTEHLNASFGQSWPSIFTVVDGLLDHASGNKQVKDSLEEHQFEYFATLHHTSKHFENLPLLASPLSRHDAGFSFTLSKHVGEPLGTSKKLHNPLRGPGTLEIEFQVRPYDAFESRLERRPARFFVSIHSSCASATPLTICFDGKEVFAFCGLPLLYKEHRRQQQSSTQLWRSRNFNEFVDATSLVGYSISLSPDDHNVNILHDARSTHTYWQDDDFPRKRLSFKLGEPRFWNGASFSVSVAVWRRPISFFHFKLISSKDATTAHPQVAVATMPRPEELEQIALLQIETDAELAAQLDELGETERIARVTGATGCEIQVALDMLSVADGDVNNAIDLIINC